MKTQTDEASIYLLSLHTLTDSVLVNFLPWLSESEVQRYQRFIRPERQRQFLAGRILLRQALARLLDMSATELELIEQAGNAPRLVRPELSDAGFSLSHSGPWVACAVSASTKLGLDIEMLNPERDFSALALQAFNADENAWLAQQDAGNRLHDFYQLWTTKEAQIKLNQKSMQCVHLPHPELSITLCSSRRLTSAPQLLQISLSAK
ncbi:4'-phosphopantetheinyl transferase family protein [Undibacterium pigrum]|uniref:4'-phosphopantetheinyl transferase n=1 Tax=Undibacterium pigrum TaxID=401470 RepID=A0A318JJE8_9BURK|nr:4'-phosphopantetheinyl transferase superfamily protein [Undibacterium pigrum]PXX47559.1 4'-phosphopantetheinyl transferase [Undibacterium pigrum]